jgi:hypothetical protein
MVWIEWWPSYRVKESVVKFKKVKQVHRVTIDYVGSVTKKVRSCGTWKKSPFAHVPTMTIRVFN